MRKKLSVVPMLIVALGLSINCSASSAKPAKLEMGAHIEKGDESTSKTAIFVGHHSGKNVLKAIKAAAHETGWEVTEFKSEAVIVEKTLGDKTISSTIVYHNQHISGDSEHAPMEELLKLRQAIVNELKKEKKEEH